MKNAITSCGTDEAKPYSNVIFCSRSYFLRSVEDESIEFWFSKC